MKCVKVIGAGLAGSEAAWQLANRGIQVELIEMRSAGVKTFAHRTDHCAELVCSNSLRSDDDTSNAVGVLHRELRTLNSLIMRMADAHRVPAGSALAVDREAFSKAVTEALSAHPNITMVSQQIDALPEDKTIPTIIATGPLTSDALSQDMMRYTGQEHLAFFDAIAPIVTKESVNMDIAWFQSRYDKGDGDDYLNCPMNQEQYEAFIAALIEADTIAFKEWEKDTPYFEGCLPIEVMAARGKDTLRFGPMKPVGLQDPRHTEPAYAVVQLRQDNKQGSLYNMVGFQTKMNYGEQKRVFQMIPALENADFARLGGIHRNIFIHSPSQLDTELRFKALPHLRFAGQVTGVEGYVESCAMGLLSGLFTAAQIHGITLGSIPNETALGALFAHITQDATAENFQPMNVHFGLMPPIKGRMKKRERREQYAKRAKRMFEPWANALTEQLQGVS